MNENQKRQKEEARKLAIENTFNVCATGEKEASAHYEGKHDAYDNIINAE